jgi:hypothetical protein
MEGNAANLYRVLGYRADNGVEVVLFWHQNTGELTVAVSDARSSAYFELAAAPDQALDVFNHPYAHAAFRGLPYADEPLASWAEAAARAAATNRAESRRGTQ